MADIGADVTKALQETSDYIKNTMGKQMGPAMETFMKTLIDNADEMKKITKKGRLTSLGMGILQDSISDLKGEIDKKTLKSLKKMSSGLEKVQKENDKQIKSIKKQIKSFPLIGKSLAKSFDKHIAPALVKILDRTLTKRLKKVASGVAAVGKAGKGGYDFLAKLGVFTAVAAVIGGIIKQIMQWEKIATDISKNTGFLRKDLGGVTDDMLSAYEATAKYGMTMEGVQETTQALLDEFGTLSIINDKLIEQAAKWGKAYGIGAQEMASTIDILNRGLGMSVSQMDEFVTSLDRDARIAGVSMNLVMRDITKDANFLALYSDETGANLREAAIQARRMGTTLSDSAAISDTFLDLETAMGNTMELNLITGSDLNAMELHRMAVMGDIDGLQQKILEGITKDNKWTEMNVLQKKRVAEMMGISVESAAKMVSYEKELKDTRGDYEKALENGLKFEGKNARAKQQNYLDLKKEYDLQVKLGNEKGKFDNAAIERIKKQREEQKGIEQLLMDQQTAWGKIFNTLKSKIFPYFLRIGKWLSEKINPWAEEIAVLIDKWFPPVGETSDFFSGLQTGFEKVIDYFGSKLGDAFNTVIDKWAKENKKMAWVLGIDTEEEKAKEMESKVLESESNIAHNKKEGVFGGLFEKEAASKKRDQRIEAYEEQIKEYYKEFLNVDEMTDVQKKKIDELRKAGTTFEDLKSAYNEYNNAQKLNKRISDKEKELEEIEKLKTLERALTEAEKERVNSYDSQLDILSALYDKQNENFGNTLLELPELSETPGAGALPIEAVGAKGGIVTKPTRALIGEAGPEMVIPLTRPMGKLKPAQPGTDVQMADGGVKLSLDDIFGNMGAMQNAADPVAVRQRQETARMEAEAYRNKLREEERQRWFEKVANEETLAAEMKARKKDSSKFFSGFRKETSKLIDDFLEVNQWIKAVTGEGFLKDEQADFLRATGNLLTTDRTVFVDEMATMWDASMKLFGKESRMGAQQLVRNLRQTIPGAVLDGMIKGADKAQTARNVLATKQFQNLLVASQKNLTNVQAKKQEAKDTTAGGSVGLGMFNTSDQPMGPKNMSRWGRMKAGIGSKFGGAKEAVGGAAGRFFGTETGARVGMAGMSGATAGLQTLAQGGNVKQAAGAAAMGAAQQALMGAGPIGMVVAALLPSLLPILKKLPKLLWKGIKKLPEVLKKGVDLFVKYIKFIYIEIPKAIWKGMKQVVNIIKKIPEAIMNAMKAYVTFMIKFWKGIGSRIWKGIKALISMPGKVISALVKAVKKALDKLNPMKGIKKGLGKLKFWSAGGVATQPTPAIIGEDGPEVVLPLQRIANGEPIDEKVSALLKSRYGGDQAPTVGPQAQTVTNQTVRTDNSDLITELRALRNEIAMLAQRPIKVNMDGRKVADIVATNFDEIGRQ